jgi:pilus assembly protein FimV
VRMLARGLALLVMILPCASWPLGLGEIAVHTSLNQPLRAEIQMLSIPPEEVEDVRVTLATQEAFDRVGINRPYVLTQLEFKPTIKGEGQPIISVTTKQPVREPFLNFLMEVEWPRGRLLREYTVLLDPPVLMDRQRSVAMQAPVVGSSAEKSVKPPSNKDPERSTPVETRRTEGVVEASQAERLGATSLTQEKPVESPSLAPSKASTYRIRRGDTLGEISQKFRPDDSLTLPQMMIAMLQANPDAFIRGNINNLMAGVIVRIPERSEIESINLQQAYTEVARQASLWRQYRAKLATQTPPLPLEQTVSGAPSGVDKSATASGEVSGDAKAGEEVSPPDANLEILAAKQAENSSTKTAVAQGVDVAALQKEMALAQELAESRLKKNEELVDRIKELEGIVAQQERLISLQSEELAKFQQQVDEQTISSPTAEEAEEESPGITAPAEASVESEAVPPVESEAAPVESNAAPVESEAAPVESEAAPVESEAAPVESEAAPVESEAAPVESEAAPVESEVNPVESEAAPVESEAAPVESESTPVDSGAVETEPPVAVQPQSEVVEKGGEPVLETGDNAESELPPEATTPSMTNVFDRVITNPIILLVLVGTGLVLIAVVWLLMSKARRRSPESASEPSGDEKSQVEAVVSAVAEAEPEVDISEVPAQSRVANDEEVQGGESSPIEPMEPRDEPPAIEHKKWEIGRGDDTIAEADVYIAYGLYDQAEELLKEALATDGHRDDYRVKLLEAYFGAQNKDAFEVLAEELHENVNGSGELWARTQAMGHEISPENPLFQIGDSDQLKATDLAPKKLDTADIDLGIEEFDVAPEEALVEVSLEKLGADLSDDTKVEAGSEIEAFTDLDTASKSAFNFNDEGPVKDEAKAVIESKMDDGESGGLGGSADETYVDLATLPDVGPGLDEDKGTQDTVGIDPPSADEEEDVLEFDISDLDLDTAGQGSEVDSDMPVQSFSDEEMVDFEISDLDFDDKAEESFSEEGADIEALELDVSLDQPEDVEVAERAASENVMEHMNDALSTEAEDTQDEVQLAEDTADIDSILQGIAEDQPTEIKETTEHVEATEEFDLPDLGVSHPDELTEIGEPNDDEDIDMGDEVGTKLDLARAYIDMGDSSGARSMLEEILEEGDSTHRKEAEELLQQIA